RRRTHTVSRFRQSPQQKIQVARPRFRAHPFSGLGLKLYSNASQTDSESRADPKILISQRQSQFAPHLVYPDFALAKFSLPGGISESEAVQNLVQQDEALVKAVADFGRSLHITEVIKVEPDQPYIQPSTLAINRQREVGDLSKLDRIRS